MSGRLHRVPNCCDGWGCTVIALCAVTGRSREEIEACLRAVGVENFNSVPPKLWEKVLKPLGFDYTIKSNDTIEPPIHAFMEGHGYEGVMLVVARDALDNGHVFAANGRQFVDFYTKGEIAKNVSPPQGTPDFRVRHVVSLRPRAR